MAGVAYLFPGQGAQALGMGKAFYDGFAESRDIYKRANNRLGFDLTALCFEGPSEELTKTDKCQLAILVTSLAAFAAFHARISAALTPVAVAGLSLGELTALAVADAIRFYDALYLVQVRAEAMAKCAAQHKGGMLAIIGLSAEAIRQICEQAGVIAANYNAPDQVVLSGEQSGIEQAEALAKAKGAKRAVRLDVDGAFHSPLMQPAAAAFSAALSKVDIRGPQVPLISNVTGDPTQDPEAIRELLIKQIVSPVRWESSMRRLAAMGVTHCLEFPPAKVLTALLRRIDPTVKCIPIDEPEDFEPFNLVLRPD